MKMSEKLKAKILEAAEYIEMGDPLKDVMEDQDICEAIEVLASIIKKECKK